MFNKLTRHFLKAYLIFSTVIFLLFIPVYFLVPYPNGMLMFLNAAFLFLISLITGVALTQTFKSSHINFMLAMTGGTFSKLLIGPLFIFLLVSNFPEYTILTVFSFLGAYLFFTGFELFQLMRNLRPHFKKEEKSENR